MRAEKELSVARLFSQSSPSDSSALKELLKREKRLTSPVYLSVSLSAGSESCSWCLLFNFPHIPAIFTSSSGQPDKEGMREENYVESATIPSFTSELATKEGVLRGRRGRDESERRAWWEKGGWSGAKCLRISLIDSNITIIFGKLDLLHFSGYIHPQLKVLKVMNKCS